MIETLVSLAAMSLSVGLPLGILVFAHRQAERDRARRAANMAAFARAHGLSSSGADLLYGQMHGVPIRLWHETRGSNKNPARYTVAEARFDPPLDLGLAVKMPHALSTLWSQLVGAQDHRLGDPAFDAAFLVRGDEPARIAALLHPQLRADLRRLSHSFGVEIGDAGVRLDVREHRLDAIVTSMLDTVSRIAAHLADHRHRIPPAHAIAEHVVVWRRLAASLGFTYYPSPLAIVGELEGGVVSAYTTRVAPFEFVTRVNATFTRPLPFFLSVRPTTSMALDFFSERDDVQIGDAAFDQRFYVRSDRDDLAKRALGSEATTRLLALSERGRIQIDSYGLALTLPNLGAPGALASLLTEVRAAADVVYAASDAAPRAQGAYR